MNEAAPRYTEESVSSAAELVSMTVGFEISDTNDDNLSRVFHIVFTQQGPACTWFKSGTESDFCAASVDLARPQ